MKPNPMMWGLLVAMLALGACSRDQPGDAATDVAPEPTTTPNEAETQASEPMPQTQPTSTTETGNPGMADPAAGSTQATVAASATSGPGGSAYVTDAAGTALYMLEGDTNGTRCTGACIEAWPPVTSTGPAPTAGTGLQPGMVSTIRRPDGSSQVTYNRHPLHRYAADGGAGRTTGHGVKDQWGTWRLVSPQGAPITAPAAPAQGQPAR